MRCVPNIGLLSINALREDLRLSHKTVSNWLSLLERLYAVFHESGHWKNDLCGGGGQLLIREDAIVQHLVPTRLSPMQ